MRTGLKVNGVVVSNMINGKMLHHSIYICIEKQPVGLSLNLIYLSSDVFDIEISFDFWKFHTEIKLW